MFLTILLNWFLSMNFGEVSVGVEGEDGIGEVVVVIGDLSR